MGKRKRPVLALSAFITFSVLSVVLLLSTAGWTKESTVPQAIAIGTTSIGSSTYVISVGMADLISKHAGISASAEVAGGSDAIVRLLRDGKVQLGMASTYAAVHGYRGDKQFAKENRVPLRALMWGSPSIRAPIVRAASGIKTIADFKGKRILGKRRVGADTFAVFNALIKAYGIDPADVKILTYSKPKEIMDALKTRTADGAIWPITMDNPGVREVQEAVELGFPSVPREKWDAVLSGLGPAFFMATVPANMYKNQPYDYYAPSLQQGVETLKDFPEEAAYRIVKAVMDHYEDLKLVHNVGKEYSIENTLNQFCLPFHPGAIKYYKEIGKWTSEHDEKQKKVLAFEGK